MTESHEMEVRWSGPMSIARELEALAITHECDVRFEENGAEATITVSLSEGNLQLLRDRVDALLVAFGEVEEHHNG